MTIHIFLSFIDCPSKMLLDILENTVISWCSRNEKKKKKIGRSVMVRCQAELFFNWPAFNLRSDSIYHVHRPKITAEINTYQRKMPMKEMASGEVCPCHVQI